MFYRTENEFEQTRFCGRLTVYNLNIKIQISFQIMVLITFSLKKSIEVF